MRDKGNLTQSSADLFDEAEREATDRNTKALILALRAVALEVSYVSDAVIDVARR